MGIFDVTKTFDKSYIHDLEMPIVVRCNKMQRSIKYWSDLQFEAMYNCVGRIVAFVLDRWTSQEGAIYNTIPYKATIILRYVRNT